MARKSRRNIVSEQPIELLDCKKEQKIKTAVYARLSVEQDGNNESIETQILMAKQYIEDHPEFEFVDSYADIGYTGTNFNRPDFMRLIDDIKMGQIQCVIVKDLSRFGRNFLETGYYIETVFPALNARLIAINDRFDSSRDEDRRGLEAPIKNMVNEMYAKDMSKKYIDSFILHSSMGDTKIGLAPFGYVVDKKNNQLVEYPETARIVKVIYFWYNEGLSMAEIARRIDKLGLKTPGQYKADMDGIPNTSKDPKWRSLVVSDILKNPQYVGDTIQGRRKHRQYTNEYIRHVDSSQWIIHPDRYQPLVSRADNQKAKDRIASELKEKNEGKDRRKAGREKFTNPLSKKVFCADCGHFMAYGRVQHSAAKDGYDVAYYICHSGVYSYCNQRIYEDYLKTFVMDQIKKLIQSLCDQKGLVRSLLDSSQKKGKLLSNERKIAYIRQKIADNEKTFETLYVNLTDELIDADEYRLLSDHYSVEKEELQGQLMELGREHTRIIKSLEQFEDLLNQLEHYVGTMEYNQELVDRLVAQIRISKSGAIEMIYNCEDTVNRYFEIINEEEQ